MGSDNLFHKRKQQTIKSLQRKENQRDPYDMVLIVCEGKKTKPNYFRGLKNELKLNNNIIIMDCPTGTDPMSIVNFVKEKSENNDYDHIYCVFDKEQTNYTEALNKVNQLQQNKLPIEAIPSVPCFEYWLLLHFKESTKPYIKRSTKTPSEQVISELRKYIREYKKNDKCIFSKTKHNLDKAITRAKRIANSQKKSGTDNPSTKVYLLVEYLKNIKKDKK